MTRNVNDVAVAEQLAAKFLHRVRSDVAPSLRSQASLPPPPLAAK